MSWAGDDGYERLLVLHFNTHLKTNLLSVDRLPPPTADFGLQLFSDPWRIVVSVGDSIVGSASLLPILTICLTPVESREVYQINSLIVYFREAFDVSRRFQPLYSTHLSFLPTKRGGTPSTRVPSGRALG